MNTCIRAPRGWYCALELDHDGPCPAWPKFRNFRMWLRYGKWRSH